MKTLQAIAGVLVGFFLTVLVLTLLFSLPGCWPPVPDPQPPKPTGKATCEAACQHWSELGCEEGQGSPGGVSCENVCERVQSSGILEWDLGCRSAVERCEDIDRCEDP